MKVWLFGGAGVVGVETNLGWNVKGLGRSTWGLGFRVPIFRHKQTDWVSEWNEIRARAADPRALSTCCKGKPFSSAEA